MDVLQVLSHVPTGDMCLDCECEIFLVRGEGGTEVSVECDCAGAPSALCA